MILPSGRLIEYNSDAHSPQARHHSHMRPHLPGPGDMKGGFGRTDNWHNGLVFDLSPLFGRVRSNIAGALLPNGTACSGNNPAVVLLTVLGSEPQARVVIDELPTVT